MSAIQRSVTYFQSPGKENTHETIALAKERVHALGIKKVLVATTSGETGALAASRLGSCELIAVTHSAGFREPNTQEFQLEYRSVIESAGGVVLTAQHALGGVNRAVRRKLNTFMTDEIIAHTLRIFSQGVKVSFEMAMMAADAGLVRADEPVMCIAGTGRGADTAVILVPANAQDFFEIRLIELVCLPAPAHPEFG
ncbi:MAG: hypothetical protein JW750_00855 [Anaerolineaceae bacterium]|nr:hypothetical protein [Anaerolineaceae bacterium]